MFFKISLLLVLVGVCFGKPDGSANNKDHVTVRPLEEIKAVGETVTFLCILENEPLKHCSFKLPSWPNSKSPSDKNPSEDPSFQYYGRGLQKGECGVNITVKDTDHGVISCELQSERSVNILSAKMTLVVAKKPKNPVLTLDPKAYVEGSNVTAKCVVAGGRPAAKVYWDVDGHEDFNRTATVEPAASDTTTVTEVASWLVTADDDQRLVTCTATHHTWKKEKSDTKTITVHYKPKFFNADNELQKEDIIYSNLVIGEAANLTVKIKANPAPISVQLTIDNNTLTVGENGDEKYQLSVLEQENGYQLYNLIIKNFSKEDDNQVGTFNVTNAVGSSVARLTFRSESSVDTTPSTVTEKPGPAIAGNTVTGIIIAVCVLVIIMIGVLMYAKFNKKWCFAKQHIYYIKNREGDYIKADEEDRFL